MSSKQKVTPKHTCECPLYIKAQYYVHAIPHTCLRFSYKARAIKAAPTIANPPFARLPIAALLETFEVEEDVLDEVVPEVLVEVAVALLAEVNVVRVAVRLEMAVAEGVERTLVAFATMAADVVIAEVAELV
jgi:hypothetical protein